MGSTQQKILIFLKNIILLFQENKKEMTRYCLITCCNNKIECEDYNLCTIHLKELNCKEMFFFFFFALFLF
jgi:hypothetical protein